MSFKISRILHAGYLFECRGTQIAFDPIFENPFSKNCYAFPCVEFDQEQIRNLKLDAVFISHYHDDHCSMDSLNLLDRATPIYMYCVFDEIFSLIKQLGFTHVYPLKLNSPIQVGPFEVIPRRALDAEVDSMFHIIADGKNVLNVVDSWIDYSTLDLLSKYNWDLILWPFQTMREIEILSPKWSAPADTNIPPEWIEQLKKLKPKNIIASSCQFKMEDWSWYNQAFFPISYQQFKNQVPIKNVLRLNPSCSILLSPTGIENASPLSWVKPIGDQDLDYEYCPELKAPSTAEIAKHFVALTETETKYVLDYCKTELLDKFLSLENSEITDWHLILYNHLGEPTDFYYSKSAVNPINWSTEISISKLYSALILGESLTSLYVRVNDQISDRPELDALSDPLIRSLYDQAEFGTYQKAQLKKIKS